MNIWHDIDPERIKKDDFVAVIEISKGGRNKYELDNLRCTNISWDWAKSSI